MPLVTTLVLASLVTLAASVTFGVRSFGVPQRGRLAPVACTLSATSLGPGSTTTSDAWFKRAVEASAPSWSESSTLDAVRTDAAAELRDQSFPGRKVEAWRRTDLSSLAAARLISPKADAGVDALVAAGTGQESSERALLVLVDGVCNAALSDLSALPESVTVGSLLSAPPGSDAEAAVLAALRAPLPERSADPRTALGAFAFAALNQASLGDVACIHVPAGVSVDCPVHVLCISNGAQAADGATADGVLTANHPSLVVSVGAGASVRVLQQYMGAGAYWTNGLTRILLDERASIEHSYVQEQSAAAVHLESVQIEAATGAKYANSLMHSGARIGRVNLLINLNGVGAHSSLRGLTLATDNQLCDVHSSTVHVRLLSQSMRALPLPSLRLRPSCSRGPDPCVVVLVVSAGLARLHE